jgi:hypothetical protein
MDINLFAAIKQNQSLNEIVTLLDMGASPEAKNKKGNSVLDLTLSKYVPYPIAAT